MALHSVKSYAQANPAYTEAALRFFIFRNFDDLLKAGAISKRGRKLIIDDGPFTVALKGPRTTEQHGKPAA
jgi:hypothetical protein